ncbi:hypothetical protein RRV45_10340 [Bacillus sp. DTU_2020_1000418_1_SI_GHA_SEK_038]|uniref:hypothetical protein n=1 Tax=Bacillus sp. DTU_2020_1000418_1_SI_GHA_SEK_038 TaxID=3077585 RepID=UPI0028E507E3|nr:hypothetical protein [Bacillus sp. DTU_2020_1000418_1_SI_GHA_SEK_038]WNS77354.1 hypothetical protein RRV45_10340 [Bacillus sp. DTU_2020_1000418_1_SI_GHA_SEK_038]
MKKTTLFFVIIILLTNSTVQALSWAFPFVVWNGKVYEVTDEELMGRLIGKRIGKVKTKPNDMTGNYYGNASNYYPKGTEYFEISGISTDTAIAVKKEEGKWMKAVYVNKAPFHWMNLFSNPFPFLILIVIILFIGLRKKKTKRYQ